MIRLINSKLIDIIPPNLKEDPIIRTLCHVEDMAIQKIVRESSKLLLLANIDQQEHAVLDNLSWQMNVDFYEPGLPLEVKRNLIKNSLRFKMDKGTPKAVEEILSVVFDESQVVEWFNYDGDPFTFKILTTDRISNMDKFTEIRKVIDTVKNKRSHLTEFVIERDNQVDEAICCALQRKKVTTIEIVEGT